MLPTVLYDEGLLFVRESWNGKKFRPLMPSLLAELKDSVKMKSNAMNYTTECPVTPSQTTYSAEAKASRLTQTSKNKMEAKSKHSNAKSSLSKERCSQRVANNTITPAAKKKLQLNSMYAMNHTDIAFCLRGSYGSGIWKQDI